jgi:hypothetical protein
VISKVVKVETFEHEKDGEYAKRIDDRELMDERAQGILRNSMDKTQQGIVGTANSAKAIWIH